MDALALIVSFIMALFQKYTSNLNKDYPSYIGLVIVNTMIAILMFAASFIFHGATLDAD